MELRAKSRTSGRSGSLLPALPEFVEQQSSVKEERLIYAPSVAETVELVGRQLSRVDLPPRALLFGVPGMGKTATLRNWMLRSSRPFWWVRVDQMFSAFLGGTASNMASVFESAEKNHAVLVFDDIDALARRRDDPRESGESRRVVAALLTALDGSRNVLPVLASTNLPAVIDPAVMRRFPFLLNFGPLGNEGMIEVMQLAFPGLSSRSAEWAVLARGLSPAEVIDVSRALGPDAKEEEVARTLSQRVGALSAMRGEK